MPDITIASSILSADFTRLGEQIRQAEQAGVDWLHVDVMDGSFVPNLTMGPFIVQACRQVTHMPIDVHLMVTNSDRLLVDFARAGATRMSVHVEGNPNLHRTLQNIRELGCHPGVVLNPGTPSFLIEPVMPLVDLVLLMSVNPGYSGQEFIPAIVPKIAEVRRMLDRLNPQAVVQVDGGITPGTLPEVYKAGARVIVSATSIFKHPVSIAQGVKELRASVPTQ